MTEPKEPHCPPDRKSHRDRVREIDAMLRENETGAVCIDDTKEHRVWYLHEITKYPRLTVVFRGLLTRGIYLIKVSKGPSLN